MVVRFLLDNQKKEENEILRNIDLYTKKDPYPNKHTEHLATFLKSCFQTELDKKLNKIRREEEARTAIRKRRILEMRRREEIRKLKELEALAPKPQLQPKVPIQTKIPMRPQVRLPELPTLQEEEQNKYEYVLRLYGYPVGILIEKDEQENYLFKQFEPIIDQEIINYIEKHFGEKIGANLNVLDDNNFIQQISYKAAEKLKLKISVDDLPKIKYYLKRDAIGAGKIDILVCDEKVNEIFTEGDKFVVVNYGNLGELHTNIRTSEKELKNLILRIAEANQKIINESNPILEVNFQGFNIHARVGKTTMMILKRI
ncbi:MAG: hypothetical protein ABIJ18_03920 [archaeon]